MAGHCPAPLAVLSGCWLGAKMGTGGPGDELYGGLLRSGRADATVVRMLLGHQLRRLREAAGVIPDQAAEEIRASRAKISRMENGRVGFKALYRFRTRRRACDLRFG